MYRFLLSAFSVDELSRLLRYTLPELAVELPGGSVAPATYVSEVVGGLARHHAFDQTLFAMLRRERPRREAEIAALQRLFGA